MNNLKNLEQTARKTQLYLPGSGILPRRSGHRKPLLGSPTTLRSLSERVLASSGGFRCEEPPQRPFAWENVSVVHTNTSLKHYCGTRNHKNGSFPQHHIQQRDSVWVHRPGFRLVVSQSVTEHKR